MLRDDNEIITQINHSDRNHSSPLAFLDLAVVQHPSFSKEKQIALLIHSLKDNYLSYGRMIAAKHNERSLRSQSDYYYHRGFFALPRVPVPAMRPDSPYLHWQRMIIKTNQLLDGTNRAPFIAELNALEDRLCESSTQHSHSIPISEILETVLQDFEKKSGFSSIVTITELDGNKGILSTEQFKSLLRNGHPLNDNGAGMQHGNLSHRLQFYLLGQYMNKHLDEFFHDTHDYNRVLNELKLKHPEMIDADNKFPHCKLISAFYRLLGTKEFNECFDWESFNRNRAELNEEYNKQKTPDELNASDIWVQLFDRYGYAGYFSVPSTFGLLQRLGCLASLPTLGIPSTSSNKHLKMIIDVTPKI